MSTKARSGGTRGPHRSASGCGLFPVLIVVGFDHRESGFGSWSSRSLQTLPEDLVVELGWNAVFSREVEAAGFRRPVLGAMSWFQDGTGSEVHLLDKLLK